MTLHHPTPDADLVHAMTKFDLLEYPDIRPPRPEAPRRNLLPGARCKVTAVRQPNLEHELLLVEVAEATPCGYVVIVADGPDWLPVGTRLVAGFAQIAAVEPPDPVLA